MGMDSVYRVSLVLDLVDNMTKKIPGPAQKVPDAVKRMSDAFGKMQKVGAVMTGVGTAVTGACLGTVTATFDTQNALAEVASLGVKDLSRLEKAAKSFSDTYVGTTKADFISASYDIKSGIASLSDEGVAKYTEMAGLTAKATKATTEEMTSLFASGYGIYKTAYNDMSDLEFGEMFSAGISTAVKNYKTSGTQMADAIKTMGASATNAKVPLEEQLAILGQLQSSMSGSEAGTKYKAFINAAAGAGEKLGLSFIDNNNQLLSMNEIIERLKGKYGDTIDAVEKQQLKEAFGTDEAVSLIDLLYNNTGQLKSGIEDLQSSMNGGIETTKKMADTINDTPAQKFDVLKQSLHNATEGLGQGLLPGINNTIEAVTKVVKKGSDWVANHQELVSVIMKIAIVLGVFLIAVGSITAVIGTLGKAMLTLKSAVNLLKTANLGLLKTMLTSPFTWVVLSVLALVAAFKACGGDAGKFGDLLNNAFSKVRSICSNILSGLISALPQLLIFGSQVIAMLLNSIIVYAPQLIQSGIMLLGQLAQGLWNALPTILSIGLSIIAMLIQAIVSAMPQLISGGIQLIGFLISGIIQAAPLILSLPGQIFLEFINMILSIDWKTVGSEIIMAIKDGITGVAGEVWSAVKGVFSGKDTGKTDSAGKGLMDGVTSGIKSGEAGASSAATTAGNNIASALHIDRTGAGTSGLELMNGVAAGIKNGAPTATSAAQNAGNNISKAMKIDSSGTGSTGSKLMNNLASGINSGGNQTITATKGVTTKITNTVRSSGPAVGNAAKSMMNTVTNSVKTGGNQAVNAAKSAANRIKAAFANIHVTVPRPRLPRVNVSYSSVGSGGATAQVPHFSVSYFKNGGILSSATVFGQNGNSLMVGGEAGKEAVIPLAELWDRLNRMIKAAIDSVANLVLGNRMKSPGEILSKKDEKTASVFSKEVIVSKYKEEIQSKEKSKQVFIENVNLELDVDDIDDLNKLKKLIEQLEEE